MNSYQTIQHLLAKSYLAYFLASLVGLFVDAFIAAPFDVGFARPIAIIFMGLGPALMLWAQYSSWRCHLMGHPHSAQYFKHGPYRLVRNPTHLGILILVTGYTLISGSLIFFATTLLGFLFSNIFFNKYERVNHSALGSEYRDYITRTPKI